MAFGVALMAGRYLWAARRQAPRLGAQAMQGARAVILDWSGDTGHVLTQGERWRARGGEGFRPGESVEVASMQGLTLTVRQRPSEIGAEVDVPIRLMCPRIWGEAWRSRSSGRSLPFALR